MIERRCILLVDLTISKTIFCLLGLLVLIKHGTIRDCQKAKMSLKLIPYPTPHQSSISSTVFHMAMKMAHFPRSTLFNVLLAASSA